MRAKILQCVVTFKTTTQAMAFEEAAKAAGFGGRLIPLPRAIGAGCGLAWRDTPQQDALMALIQSAQLGYEQIHEIVI